MTEAFTGGPQPDQYAPVARVERSGLIEGVHFGAVVQLDSDGQVSAGVGDPDQIVYPRSALKPIQAAAMVRAGLALPAPELALVAASHDGEPQHEAGVLQILHRHGLAVTALQNTPGYPGHEPSRLAVIRGGRGRESLTADCSGKHAGMLATCVVNGFDVDSYLDADHPLQQLMRAEVATLSGEPVAHTGVDGCGAPAFAISLAGLARAFAACVTATPGEPPRTVADAMRAHPEMVGGTSRDVTAFMQRVPGLLAKEGAEAVYAAALPDGGSVALKVSDGGFRAAQVSLAATLVRLGVEPDLVASLAELPVLGHGRPVGAVTAVDHRPPGER